MKSWLLKADQKFKLYLAPLIHLKNLQPKKSMKHEFSFKSNRVKLDQYIANVSASDDSSTHSGEYYPISMPNLQPSICDHLLPDVT